MTSMARRVRSPRAVLVRIFLEQGFCLMVGKKSRTANKFKRGSFGVFLHDIWRRCIRGLVCILTAMF